MNAPFFSRPEVKAFIDQVSSLSDCVIYVGAGASIGRTGLSWAALIAQLMEESGGTLSERIDLVKALSPLAASSAATEQFATTRGAGWRVAQREVIRDQLYRGSGYSAGDPGITPLAGSFNDRVVNLALTLLRKRNVTLVTTNYDQFLLDSIALRRASMQASVAVRVFAAGIDDQGSGLASTKMAHEIIRSSNAKNELTVVYLHGIVPRHDVLGSGSGPYARSFPVVSERDYAESRRGSERVLTDLFQGRDAIVVGASVTDPPLIAALAGTRTSGHRRFVIQPSADFRLALAPADRQPDARGLQLLRSRHLGLTTLVTDHFHQVSQILDEVRENLQPREHPHAYIDIAATHTYGHRLDAWWSAWLASSPRSIAKRQRQVHHSLRSRALPGVQSLLEVDEARERLILEVWLRIRPNGRQLWRWASSEAIFVDEQAMAHEVIAEPAKYVATQALINGAPTFAPGRTDESRLRSFLAAPIYFGGSTEDVPTNIPVGAVCLASSLPQSESSLNSRSKMKRAELFAAMDGIGRLVADPEFYRNPTDPS